MWILGMLWLLCGYLERNRGRALLLFLLWVIINTINAWSCLLSRDTLSSVTIKDRAVEKYFYVFAFLATLKCFIEGFSRKNSQFNTMVSHSEESLDFD